MSPAHFSETDSEQIVKFGQAEIDFERRRREIAPNAASRLSCLYMADDDEFGRNHLQRMLGYNIHILRVRVPLAIRVSKCDTKWFDEYCDSQDIKCIDNYWKDISMNPKYPTWEYLVDGMIEANDPGGMEYLLKNGVNIAPQKTKTPP